MNAYSRPTLAFWSDSEPLECVSRLPEAPNVVTFTFQAPSGALFNYRPGQFVTLELPVPGGPLHRTYTISSIALAADLAHHHGQGAERLARHALDARQPPPRRAAEGDGTGGVLLLRRSSGAEIPVHLGRLRHHADDVDDDAHVRCRARSRHRLHHLRAAPVGDHLPATAGAHGLPHHRNRAGLGGGGAPIPTSRGPGIAAASTSSSSASPRPTTWSGRSSAAGPNPSCRRCARRCTALATTWTATTRRASTPPCLIRGAIPEDVTLDGEETAEVEFAAIRNHRRKSPRRRRCWPPPASAGALIPSGCTFGVCGTCKVRKTAGEVHMVHNGGITEEDIAAGYVLACCSKPIGKRDPRCLTEPRPPPAIPCCSPTG